MYEYAFAVMMALFAAVLGVMLLVAVRPGANGRWSAAWIRDRRAPITRDLQNQIELERGRSHVGALVGGLVCVAAIYPFVFWVDVTDDVAANVAFAALFVPLMGMYVGQSINGVNAAVREPGSRIRVAHTRASAVTDHVGRWGLWTMRLQQVSMVAACLAASSSPRWTGVAIETTQLAVLWGSALAVVVVWASAELLTRRLNNRPLSSPDPVTLFWRTALRGERLRSIYLAPVALGWLVPSLVSRAIPRLYGTPAATWEPETVFVMSMVLLGLTVLPLYLLNLEPRSHQLDDARHAALRAYATA